MGKDVKTRFDKGFSWLSNSLLIDVEMGGDEYHSVEHALQASKFYIGKVRRKIASIPCPMAAKRYAWSMRDSRHIWPQWDELKKDIMLSLLYQKFADEWLQGRIRATGNKRLINVNHWHDNYWGTCRCNKCKSIKGENLLGKMLEQVRSDPYVATRR